MNSHLKIFRIGLVALLYLIYQPSHAQDLRQSATSKMNVYFLSGLGADKRVFSKLKLDDRFEIHHIEWIKPENKETISHYAARLTAGIDTTRPFQLVGVSFGGMIATEMTDLIKPEQVILISSTPVGIPLSKGYQRLVRFLLLSPFAAPVLKSTNSIVYKYFGADTPELKAMLKDILHDTDSKFLKWALNRLTTWDRKTPPPHYFHVHGANDRLIQLKLVKPDIVIPNAGHLMVYGQADQISEILNKQLLLEY